MTKCCVCERDKEVFKTLTLTAHEREFVMLHTGAPPPLEYAYCKPCWLAATDKTQGPQLVKGILQLKYQRAGVRNAEALATRVQDFLAKKSTPKPS